MLQSIREMSQGWLAWLIVIMLCLVFALWGVHSYLYGRSAENLVAKINGVKITKQQLNVVYNQMRRQQQLQLGANYSSSEKAQALLKKIALQTMISSIALNKAAKKDGFRVAPILVEKLLASMPIFQVNGVFSQARFQLFVNNLLYSADEYLAQLQNEILVTQVRNAIIGTSFVLPQEVKKSIQLINQKRSFHYAIIPINHFLAKVKLKPKDAENFYQQNLDSFKLPEKVSVEYLKLSIADLMRTINPGNTQLKDFYQNNIASFTKPKQLHFSVIMIAMPQQASSAQIKQAQDKLALVTSKIKQHADFASLAKQYSDDAHSAAQGGKWPWISAVQLPAELRAVLPNLQKVGDISMPIKTRQGYFILKLLGFKSQQVVPFNTVKKKVLRNFKQQTAEQKFADLRDQLANITYENSDSLDPAAKQLKLPIQTTGLFTKDGGKKGIISNPRFVAAAFNDEVLNQRDNSDPIDLSDNSVIVLRVKQHIPAAVKSFAQIKSLITNKLRQQAATQQAMELGDAVVKELQAKKSLQDIARANKLNWKNIINASRHDARVDVNILDAAFNLSRSTKVSAQSLRLPSNNYAVVILDKVQEGAAQKLSATQRRAFKKTEAQKLGLLEYQLYAQGLLQQAKVKKFAESS